MCVLGLFFIRKPQNMNTSAEIADAFMKALGQENAAFPEINDGKRRFLLLLYTYRKAES